MKLCFGSDHAGFALRQHLVALARSNWHEVDERGTMSTDSFDYPRASDAVAHEVLAGRADLGILICGSGIGVSIRANRFPGIRAALCFAPLHAELARQHNHANVLCLGARLVSADESEEILVKFLSTEPDLDARHSRRVELLDEGIGPA